MGFDSLSETIEQYMRTTRDDPSKWSDGGDWFMDGVTSTSDLLTRMDTAQDNATALAARTAGDSGAIAAARSRLNWTASMRRDLRKQFFGSDDRLRRPFDSVRHACLRRGYVVLVLQRIRHIISALMGGGSL